MSLKKEEIKVFKKFLTKEDCEYYSSLIRDLGPGDFDWPTRTVDITNDPIVNRAILFFKNKLNLNLKIRQAQLQNWNEGSEGELHVHAGRGTEHTKYNSLIYLNDDFEGGEFYTNKKIIKPEKGMLTIFDGSITYHGVKKVKKKDRKTIILWWKK
jgi:hypothetical protein